MTPVARTGAGPATQATARAAACAQWERDLTSLQAATAIWRATDDPEALHDLRVAIRRLRNLLRLFGEVLAVDTEERIAELGWLGGELAPTRDLDIQVAEVQNEQRRKHRWPPAAFDEVLARLTDERAAAHDRALATLQSDRCRALLDSLRWGLESVQNTQSPAEEGMVAVAPDVIGRCWRSVEKAGKVVLESKANRRSDPAYHRLRIRNKRLRDGLEFVAPSLDGQLEPISDVVLALHDTLGRHQDAAVAAEHYCAMLAAGASPEAEFVLRDLVRRSRNRTGDERLRARALYERALRLPWRRVVREPAPESVPEPPPPPAVEPPPILEPEEPQTGLPVEPIAAAAAQAPVGAEPEPVVEAAEATPPVPEIRRGAMDVYLVRHGDTFDRDLVAWPNDSDRPLTPKGERRWRRAARGFGNVVPEVTAILSSPLVRAWRTAEILADTNKGPVPEQCEALAPESNPTEVLDLLRERPAGATVVLVGHEPHLHTLLSYLLTGDAAKAKTAFEKGAVAYVSFDDEPTAGGGELHWLLSPKALRCLRPRGRGKH